MLQALQSLTWADYLYAAVMAYILMRLVTNISKLTKVGQYRQQGGETAADLDRKTAIQNCVALFPVDTVHFRGQVFTKGMMVRITTYQKRIIEGELIGRNEKGLLCVIVGPHIIAHEIDKIEDMVEMTTLMQK